MIEYRFHIDSPNLQDSWDMALFQVVLYVGKYRPIVILVKDIINANRHRALNTMTQYGFCADLPNLQDNCSMAYFEMVVYGPN